MICALDIMELCRYSLNDSQHCCCDYRSGRQANTLKRHNWSDKRFGFISLFWKRVENLLWVFMIGNCLAFLSQVVSRSLLVISLGLWDVRKDFYQYCASSKCHIVIPKGMYIRFLANKYSFHIKCRLNQNIWIQNLI